MNNHLTIVIIESIKENESSLSQTLQLPGTIEETVIFDHLEPAFAYLKKEDQYKNAKTPNLVLLDLDHQEKQGIELLSYIKNDSNKFNEELNSQLQELVFEIDKVDREKLVEQFYIKPSLIKKIVLFIPAIIGFIINAPLYFTFHLVIRNRAEDHYDSIMTGLLFLFYPLYVLAITLIVFFLTESLYSLLLLILIPFSVWSYLQLKRQIPK